MVDGLLLALLIINAYIIALFLLHRRGYLSGPVLELVGPLLMWRTEHGKRIIDKVSKARTFWKAWGDAGVVLTYVSGLGVLFILVWQLSLVFSRPDILREAAPGVEYYLVLPGINPLIPVWFGILGLAVALVVHEGAHGVLSRVHDIKVKSLGLLFFVVPIGAFVEPDDEELEKAPTRVKNRVFAAGVMANLCVAVLAAAVFAGAFWASAHPAHDGLGVHTVVPGQPADLAGIAPGMIITHLDGVPVRTVEGFNAVLATKGAGDPLLVTLWVEGATVQRQVVLADKLAYYQAADPSRADPSFAGQGFLGITSAPMALMANLRDTTANPFAYGAAGVGRFISLPFQGLSPMPPGLQALLVIEGPLAAMPPWLFWILADSLYWIFWLNLMVGTFNALPAGPLDGGQMFKASLRGALRRYFGVAREHLVVEKPLGARGAVVKGADEATQRKVDRIDGIVRTTTLTLGLVILGLILFPIVGAQLL